jgi:HlyD family secretion protein
LEHERLERLCEHDAAPAAQLEQAAVELDAARARAEECECQIAVAEAQLEAARSELAKTMVYAPMEGTVTSLMVKPGERVVGTSTMAGTETMTIADLGRMELVVQVGENDIRSIKVEDRARIKPDAAPSTTLEGRVSKIALRATGAGAMNSATDFEVRINIDSQDVISLLPGMSASVVIDTGSKNDILTVPLQAIVIKDGLETVWTVDQRQQVHRRTVECGIQDFGRIEITAGLSEDDLVVAGPYQLINKNLSEGDRVKIGDGFK